MTDEPLPPTSRFRFMQLDAQVTHDFCTWRSLTKRCYALLHDSGSYVRTEAGPVVSDSWGTAVQLAQEHGTHFIAIVHDEKIKFARSMPHGGITWERVLFQLHEETARELANTTEGPKHSPIDAHGRSKTSIRNHATKRGARKR